MSSLERSVRDGAPGFGLPNRYYTDPEILGREMAVLFGRSWQIAGRESDLSEPGAYLTFDVGSEPVLVARGHDMVLHAMFNVCAHRGMRLATGAGTTRRLVCPYHRWTYDLDGSLVSAPYSTHLSGGFDKASVRLPPARVDTWGGFVFVNLDPEAEDLRSYLGGMVDRWDEYHPDWGGLREATRLTYTEPFNWKIFMENSTDYYHIPFIHEGSLGLPPVLENQASGRHFMLTTSTPDDGYRRFFDLLFPNSYFHVAPNKIQHFKVMPVDPGTSRIDVVLYQTQAQAERYPMDDPSKHRDLCRILDEDFAICRALQRQTASTRFGVGFSARDFEDAVNHFDRAVLAALA